MTDNQKGTRSRGPKDNNTSKPPRTPRYATEASVRTLHNKVKTIETQLQEVLAAKPKAPGNAQLVTDFNAVSTELRSVLAGQSESIDTLTGMVAELEHSVRQQIDNLGLRVTKLERGQEETHSRLSETHDRVVTLEQLMAELDIDVLRGAIEKGQQRGEKGFLSYARSHGMTDEEIRKALDVLHIPDEGFDDNEFIHNFFGAFLNVKETVEEHTLELEGLNSRVNSVEIDTSALTGTVTAHSTSIEELVKGQTTVATVVGKHEERITTLEENDPDRFNPGAFILAIVAAIIAMLVAGIGFDKNGWFTFGLGVAVFFIAWGVFDHFFRKGKSKSTTRTTSSTSAATASTSSTSSARRRISSFNEGFREGKARAQSQSTKTTARVASGSDNPNGSSAPAANPTEPTPVGS